MPLIEVRADYSSDQPASGTALALLPSRATVYSAGVLNALADLVARADGLPPVLLGVLTIWVVAILSGIVDNVPITIALIPVIHGLGVSGVDIRPLWRALAFGAGFGGNGTIIGATAHVIVASLSERTSRPLPLPSGTGGVCR